MSKSIREEVEAVIRGQTAYRGELRDATELQKDLGVYGLDMDELLEEYTQRFGVDMSSYLWYFHTGEEGSGLGLGQLVFPAPNQRVEEIPITVALLVDCANAGVWLVDYPEHSLPSRRYDVMVNNALVLLLVILVVYFCLR